MQRYGQFCAVARSLELVGERWTLLVVRELLMGSRRFGEIRRGIPRISRTMLTERLRALTDAGVVVREGPDALPSYRLTPAGEELAEVVRALGVWGQRWARGPLDRDELDEAPLLWDVQRRVNEDALPDTPVVVRFELTDVPARRRVHYLLLRRGEVSVCDDNPGLDVEVRVRSDRRTLIGWWRGDLTWRRALASGALTIEGPRALVRAFPEWFHRYAFAGVAPAGEKSA
ncbi:winged helix-turn-helix transcriptional regulator [Sandaracinus amylolyticus]|uniref:winged helix-turn-helix transcriptional regulator n=1 Tax=Sandaracinus amylolyticus TaxID=927083 RepID=UPI001F1F7752|nr:helix-turn-helix domain-containing protein [Sandaracinus amylolyticus]